MDHPHRQPVDDTAAIPSLAGDANVSVDVDGLDCYRAIHGLDAVDGGADPVWTVGVERALALFAKFEIPATFFVVGRDLKTDVHRQLTAQTVDDGHEVANHSMDHHYDLPSLPEMELAHQIEAADRLIEEVTGVRPVGFRAPGYNVTADVIAFCRRAGYRYDASVFPCKSYWLAKAAVMRWRRIRGEQSRSASTDARNLRAPAEPYFPDPLDCWRASSTPGGFVEIPVATVARGLVPIIGTSIHLLDTVGFQRIWPLIDAGLKRFFSFEMHAIDFVDLSDLQREGIADADELATRQPDLRIPWEKKARRYEAVFNAMRRDRAPVTLAEATRAVGSTR